MLRMRSYHFTLQEHLSTQLKRGGTFFSHFPCQSLQQLSKIIPLWIILPDITENLKSLAYIHIDKSSNRTEMGP